MKKEMKNIVTWNEIQNHYNDSLILGNGASIAVSGNFAYDSLYEKACELNLIDDRLRQIFSNFKTTNFETVLHKLLQAKIITESLSINSNQITNAYENCRSSLIKIIQNIHPKYDSIDSNQFVNISNFLKNFKTVISLNYDLILYWSMFHGNQLINDNQHNQTRSGNRFKDCFSNSSNGDKLFNLDLDLLRQPHGNRRGSTLIFYLHGNLTLADYINKTSEELEVKITSPGTGHLQAVYNKWKSNYYSPLFVCEGDTNRKLASIKKSIYLNTIYNDVFNDLGNAIAIYGWNMNDQDNHVLEQLGAAYEKNKFKKVAISVYKNGHEQDFIKRVFKKVHKIIDNQFQIDFYDSASLNCWNNN